MLYKGNYNDQIWKVVQNGPYTLMLMMNQTKQNREILVFNDLYPISSLILDNQEIVEDFFINLSD
jgi:hypothetical protein